MGSPTVAKEPVITSIGFYSASFSLKLWEIGKVYAIVKIKNGNVNASNTPLSTQIFKGNDENNIKVPSKYFFYKKTD
jgi:hypothetical protein